MTFVIYVGLALCAAYFGRNRSIGFWGFLIPSLVLFPIGPFVTLLILAVTKERH